MQNHGARRFPPSSAFTRTAKTELSGADVTNGKARAWPRANQLIDSGVRALIAFLALAVPAIAADRFIGWQSCATSGCHGGGQGDDQVLTWRQKDPHSRAYGILISERSKRMAEALGIADASKSNQCTVCHSPMHSADSNRIASSLKQPNQGVSCESCHGPAEGWLRFHTRADITRDQRYAAGMRNLETAYRRSNTCVGCHGNLPAELQKAGHPTLRFELARQLVELPPHWQDFEQSQSGAAWLTGQATLLRELCWLAEKGNAQTERIAALHWILRETKEGASTLPSDTTVGPLRAAADRLAKNASSGRWSAKRTRAEFDRIAALSSQVKDAAPPTAFARAEVLTPALRALVLGLDPKVMEKAKVPLGSLDLAVRSSAILDPKRYPDTVAELIAAVQAAP